ncbi:hypothetical protein CBL_04771 [Carabus blaptoides fortunei]
MQGTLDDRASQSTFFTIDAPGPASVSSPGHSLGPTTFCEVHGFVPPKEEMGTDLATCEVSTGELLSQTSQTFFSLFVSSTRQDPIFKMIGDVTIEACADGTPRV